jgi:hypothetical protein
MGADLILDWVEIPEPCTEEDVSKAITLLVGLLGFDDLLGYFDDTLFQVEDWFDALEGYGVPESGDIEDADRDVAVRVGRELVEADLQEAAKAIWFSYRRDISMANIRCQCGCNHVNRLVIGGAMSWGDEPEFARPMELLNTFGVVNHVKSDLQHLADTAKEQ